MKSKYSHKKKKKRVGRGNGSGHGKTSCRGQKGQMSRSGASRKPGFEGGQMTYIRRLPKRGFNNVRFGKDVQSINIHALAGLGVSEVTPLLLLKKGIITRKNDGLKVLGTGKIDKAVTVHAHAFSASAQKKIEAAGGKAILITKQ